MQNVNINAEIVELINGIVSHGGHLHTEYTKDDFESMFLLVKLFDCDEEKAEYSFGSLDVELVELYEELESKQGEDDFTIDFDGNEYRIIAESSIWDIYVDEIKQIVNDCYDLKLDEVPSWIALDIDWEQTAKNAYVDGYGHTFASYDGEESEAADYWIFRTN